MNPRRVILVSPYALNVFGGVQEQVLAMARELERRDTRVLVLAPNESDHARYDLGDVQRFGRLISIPANGSRAPLTLSPRAARAAREAAHAFKPDVVHFHEPFAPLLGWSILRAHRAPAVATFHRSGSGPAFTLTKPLLRSLARGVDVATAVSGAAASTIRDATGIVPDVLFNGFETERFVALPRERSSDIVVLCLGRLEERKGAAFAIEAVRAHNARGHDRWRLVVVGEGPERAKLQDLAVHDNMITFVGSVDDEQKRRWLRRANVLVAPANRGESFGLIILEAMASETLVVASDIPGYRDAAGGHAELFEPSNALQLERAIVNALEGETPERIASARAHAQHWSMERLVSEYEDRYELARSLYVERG
ncbi:MAG: glycosyltransferase family 4 protein [Acidobacteria bacterium]|nr:glycosyltransferase family 4 protein [Acidobacteriota bacterium]